jgi:hypothetical protein
LKFLFFFIVALLLECRAIDVLSAAVIEDNAALPSLAEMTELPIPAREVIVSKRAAKMASLSETRDSWCLVNLNIIVSRVEFSVLVVRCCSEV